MLLLYILLLQNVFHVGQSLVSCNESETVSVVQLCTLVPYYDVGVPSEPPARIDPLVTLFSVTELNEDQRTISLNVLLSFWWNDTRLTLTPKGFNE